MPLLVPLGAIVFFQVADYWSFLLMIGRHGLAAEANPLVFMIAGQLGVIGATAVKLAGVVIASASLILVADRHRGMARAIVTGAVIAGLIGALTNIASL